MKIDHEIVYFHHPNDVWLVISGLHSNFAGQKEICRFAGQKKNYNRLDRDIQKEDMKFKRGRWRKHKGMHLRKRPKPFSKGKNCCQAAFLAFFFGEEGLSAASFFSTGS